MHREPFRFLHAAALRLDHQLCGVGSVPEKVREIVEEASLIAFERVIEACLEHDVDFLLLAGDSFDAGDAGLRGPMALARGFQRLAEHEIATCVVAGPHDPWSSWLSGIHYPELVHRLRPGANTPTMIDCPTSPLAAVYGVYSRTRHDEVKTHRAEGVAPDGRYAIGLASVALDEPTLARWDTPDGLPALIEPTMNYWALGGGVARRTVHLNSGLLHDPAAPQGFSAAEAGPRGCTLVEVDAGGAANLTFLPTAPVRWERVYVNGGGESIDQQSLVSLMRSALAAIERFATDDVWLVDWIIGNLGTAGRRMAEPEFRRETLDAVHRDLELGDISVHTHRVSFANEGLASEPEGQTRGLMAQFATGLAAKFAVPDRALHDILADSELRGGPWEGRIRDLLPELDVQEIAGAAQREGCTWFADLKEAA